MIDPMSVALALGLLGAGWLLGRHTRLKSAPKQPKPICLCGHHYGTHDPETGACNEQWQESPWSSTRGTYQVSVECTCLRYVGPVPVEQYWVPPAADMSIVTAPRPIDRAGDR